MWEVKVFTLVDFFGDKGDLAHENHNFLFWLVFLVYILMILLRAASNQPFQNTQDLEEKQLKY